MNLLYFIVLIIIFLEVNLCEAGWVQQSSGTNQNLNCITFSHASENYAWACGDNGVILYTSNGGINWVLQDSGTLNNLYSICFVEVSGGPVFAVGAGGTILRTTNSGTNWISVFSPVNKTLRDISEVNFIAVGDSGTIIRSTNQGLNWNIVLCPVILNLNAVCSTFGFNAVGDNGTIIKSFSPGTNWLILKSGTNRNLYGVPMFGSTDLTVGDSGLVLRSTDFGTSWSSQLSGTSAKLRSVEYSVNNTSRIYVCGNNGLILKSTNYGNIWGIQNTPTTQNLNSLFFYLNDNTGYVCGNGGTILKTTNGGGPLSSESGSNYSDADKYCLEQNYPNPFNPVTKINYSIAKLGFVSLKVYDLIGKEIITLVSEEKNPGNHSIDFDANSLSGGVYFYRLKTGNYSSIKKMMLIK